MYYYKSNDGQLIISATKIGSHEMHEDNLTLLGEYSSAIVFVANNATNFTIDGHNTITPLAWVHALQEHNPEINTEEIMNAIRYSKTQKAALFQEELSLISSRDLRETVMDFLNTVVPDYFWEIPASSTGKHHPSFDLGYAGLVRHTKMVVAVARELMQLDKYERGATDDVVYVSCILHDTFKNGNANTGHTVHSHASIAADEFFHFANRRFKDDTSSYTRECIRNIHNAIDCHMGQWGTRSSCATEAELVHLADYIASRKFFDKFKEEDSING